ncbi:MAG: TadE/TadG family type IV pilus assembly protein [Rickettsiales bacterium]
MFNFKLIPICLQIGIKIVAESSNFALRSKRNVIVRLRNSIMYHSISSMIREQCGSAIPIIGISLFAIMSAVGVSIDMSRAQLVQSRMSSALDNAGLAAAATISTNNIDAEAGKYFNANFPAAYMGTNLGALVVTPNADNSVLSLSINGTVPTVFMQIFGINTIAVSANSEVTRASKGLEVVLVMDTTGSMTQSAGDGISKITAAKSAAISLVNILYGSNETIPNLWIGLVPFSQTVNIGTGRDSWTSSTSFNWGTTSWAGCVESRSNGTLTPQYDINDDPPSVRLFPKYYAPDDSYNNWISNTGTYSYSSTKGPNVYCPKAITPMTASKTTISNAINAMTTGGNTHINLGVVWGWRMISPRWQGLWGGEMNTNNLPLAYNSPLMNKAVIIMTDGDNTISDDRYSAYGYPDAGQLGPNPCPTSSCSTGETELNTRTTTACSNIKANGSNVVIYTIAFGTTIGTTAKNMLKACASKPEFYFASPTGADLAIAFNQIGDSLANLRISK